MDDAMPNCFILGAAKSGTTTLADLLRQSPKVYLPYAKEPHYFSSELKFNLGLDWYHKTFYQKAQGFPLRIDASTSYLYWSQKVAPRLKTYDTAQNIKLIAIFRNPVQRAYSMYWHMVRDNRESLPFEQALAAEEELYNKNWDSLNERGSQEYGLYRGGCYAALLKPFLELFPTQRLLLLLQDDLLQEPESTITRITDFLGIEPIDPINITKSNPAAMPRSKRLHNFLFKPSGFPQKFLKLFTRYMSYETRYRLKNKVMRANLRPDKYEPLSPTLEAKLKTLYLEDLQQLEIIMRRDLSKWYALS
jgi:hypothetical protein